MNVPDSSHEADIRTRWARLREDRVGRLGVRDALIHNPSFTVGDGLLDEVYAQYRAVQVGDTTCIVGRIGETFVIVEVV